MGKGVKRAKKNAGVGVDFRKVKHKVGKKLPKAQNDTRTDFQARSINLPNQSITQDKAGAAVSARNLTIKVCVCVCDTQERDWPTDCCSMHTVQVTAPLSSSQDPQLPTPLATPLTSLCCCGRCYLLAPHNIYPSFLAILSC